MKKLLTILMFLTTMAGLAAPMHLEPAKQKKLNLFFSNFSEAFVKSFKADTLTDEALLEFALYHLNRNQEKSLKKTKDGNSTIATSEQVDASTMKYFGKKIQKHKDTTYTTPRADGEAFVFSQLDSLEDQGNGLFKAEGTIYSTGSGGTPDMHGTPADWKKAGEEVEVSGKFSAAIKVEGERYGLIEYTVTEVAADSQKSFEASPFPVICSGKVKSAGGIVLREDMNRKGKEICKIPTKADLEILRLDGPEETIEGITANWYFIRWNSPQGKREGWAFGGFIDSAQEQKKVSPQATDKTQWIGQNSETVAEKMGLQKRSTKEITTDGLYALELFRTSGKTTTVTFGKLSGKKPDGEPMYTVLDMLVLPPLSEKQFVSDFANVKDQRDDELFGIALYDDKGGGFKKSEKVWRAHVKTGKMEEASAVDVTLDYPTEEGNEVEMND